MGLAMGFGSKDLKDGSAKIDAEAVSKDQVVQGGLKFVGAVLADVQAPRFRVDPDADTEDAGRNLYFLWSLERVGMVYGLTTVGDVDWYDWGSKRLLAMQDRRIGAWPGAGFSGATPEVATALALLFLSKSNLASDMTTRMTSRVQDPGAAKLKSDQKNKAAPDPGSAAAGPKPSTGTTRPDTTPPAAPADDAKALADALVAAKGGRRDQLIAEYRDTPGAKYSDALLVAIARLSGEAKTQARDALTYRLTRMSARTLNGYMADPAAELRRSAALAAGAKGRDRLGEFAAALVKLTGDPDAEVSQAARASLKVLTGQDFGPEANAGADDRAKASAAWKEWWGRQK
jgi:hypothetical protein